MTRRPASPVPARPARALALGLALASAATAFGATSPADGASPDSTPAWIHPVVGVLITGTVSSDRFGVTNPDGSVAVGNLGGRYEALAGAEFPIDPNGLAIRLTAGIHVSGPFTGAEGTEHLTRFPLEATLWYPVSDTLRVGAGARYAMRSRFSGAGNKTSDGLNATPSLIVGVGYRVMPHLLLDLRYVYERYEQASGNDVDASHWGAGLTAIY